MHPLTVRQTAASPASLSYAQIKNMHSQAFTAVLVVQESERLAEWLHNISTDFQQFERDLFATHIPVKYRERKKCCFVLLQWKLRQEIMRVFRPFIWSDNSKPDGDY